MKITEDILIEDLVEMLPESVGLLKQHGLPCIICGEPVWGTLEDLARSKGVGEPALQALLMELNRLRDANQG